MKERPIIFSGKMVRAILDGRKTQTRRVGNMRGADRVRWHVGETHAWKGKPPQHYEGWVAEVNSLNGLLLPLRCPFGQPGDRLWCREKFCAGRAVTESGIGLIPWTGPLNGRDYNATQKIVYAATDDYGSDQPPWRPSIHMPRWASRITLEVTGVRVERLVGISRDDVLAEGWDCWEDFVELWNHLNEKRGFSWASNPWVWVIEFRRVQDAKAVT